MLPGVIFAGRFLRPALRLGKGKRSIGNARSLLSGEIKTQENGNLQNIELPFCFRPVSHITRQASIRSMYPLSSHPGTWRRRAASAFGANPVAGIRLHPLKNYYIEFKNGLFTITKMIGRKISPRLIYIYTLTMKG